MNDPGKQPQILNASSNLIGICFVIIAGLKITGLNDRTLCDEICITAAFGFLCACIVSYVALGARKHAAFYERVAELIFICTLLLLFAGVTLFAKDLL